jgi:pSer/pThr/pTyr-binding forkhead associated (FHA) protein
MPAYFFCQTGEFAGSSFEIADEAMIGRNESDVRLPAETVSGTHARIYFDDDRGAFFLEDLGSSNGTKLDGVPVTDPVKLGRLHVVTFADRIDFIFHEGGGASAKLQEAAPAVDHTRAEALAPAAVPPAEGEADGTQTIRTEAYRPGTLPDTQRAASNQTVRTDAFAPGALPAEEEREGSETIRTDAYRPVTPPSPPADGAPPADGEQQTRLGEAYKPTSNLPGSGGSTANPAPNESEPVRFSLEVTRGDRGRVTFPLAEGDNTVGRASDCGISIDDKSVSRRHAVMTVRNGRVTLRDLDSRNHTFLDEQRVTTEVDVPLGAVVRFGLESEAKLRRA